MAIYHHPAFRDPDPSDPAAVARWRERCARYDAATDVLRRWPHRAARVALTALLAVAVGVALKSFLAGLGIELVSTAPVPADLRPVFDVFLAAVRHPVIAGVSLAQIAAGTVVVGMSAQVVSAFYREVVTSRVPGGQIAGADR